MMTRLSTELLVAAAFVRLVTPAGEQNLISTRFAADPSPHLFMACMQCL